MISATSGPGRSWVSRRSSLTTSGRSSGMNASEAVSAPTSSSATPQPRSRTRWTVRSSSAGRSASARSVISTTTRSRAGALSAIASRSSSGAESSTSGSTLTKRPSGATRWCSTAPRKAAARQASSSSASSPASRAAPKSANGLCRGPSGPRASASKAATRPESRCRIGWKWLRTSPLPQHVGHVGNGAGAGRRVVHRGRAHSHPRSRAWPPTCDRADPRGQAGVKQTFPALGHRRRASHRHPRARPAENHGRRAPAWPTMSP